MQNWKYQRANVSHSSRLSPFEFWVLWFAFAHPWVARIRRVSETLQLTSFHDSFCDPQIWMRACAFQPKCSNFTCLVLCKRLSSTYWKLFQHEIQGRCGKSPHLVTDGVMIRRILRWTFPMSMMSNLTCSDRPLPTCKTSIVVIAMIYTLFKTNTKKTTK